MGYTKSNYKSEDLQGKEIAWKVPAKKKERKFSEETTSRKEENSIIIFPLEPE